MAKMNLIIDKLLPGMLVVIVLMAFGMGVMWTKLQTLEKDSAVPAAAAQPSQPTAAAVAPAQPKVTLDQIKDIFNKSVIKFGKADTKLVFVEVADPSCPYCHAAAGKDPELSKQMGAQFVLKQDGGTYVAPVEEIKKLVDQGKAAFAYIYFPGHGNGEMGMKALFCAQEKGKFWPAHDLIMSNAGYNLMNTTVKNDKTQSQVVADFLKGAVDASFMKSCLDSGKYDSKLSEEQTLASSIGVNGTPGFYINTTNFAGAYNYTDMQSAVDAALK